MDPITRQAIAVAGGAAASDPLYVDDVFSTFLYDGSQPNAQTINNGLDLSGEGGLVWLKQRSSPNTSHFLFDTERGTSSTIGPDSADAAYTSSRVSSFNSNGFSLTNDGYSNGNGYNYVSWSFRKAPGFFDVVTYTGNGSGSGQTISHNLDSIPGMIIIKRTNAAEAWAVFHRSTGNNYHLRLQSDVAGYAQNKITGGSATSFQVMDADGMINGNGDSYVAYLFAHDDARFGENGDEAIIKCGSYTTNSSGVIPDVDLGFEPQWLLLKNSSNSGDWYLYDSMRGMPVGGNEETLYPNLSNAAVTGANTVELTSTGFTSGPDYLASGTDTFIYMAIRRPNKPPTAGTEVFAVNTRTGNATAGVSSTAGFPVDMAIITARNAAHWSLVFDRLRGSSQFMGTQVTNTEDTNTSAVTGFDSNTGIEIGADSGTWGTNRNSETIVDYLLRRAPSFMDVVAYTGTGSSGQAVNHNLGVIPEMIILKDRTGNSNWFTYHTGLSSGSHIDLNQSYAESGDGGAAFALTSTTITFDRTYVDNINTSSRDYIAYLFATLDGISKVGSYTGTGSDVNVDCGFTAGARFVLIKRTDSSGDWYFWDTARGIVSGNDPYLAFNLATAEVTNTDYIDPLNAGFTVTSSAPAALNASGGTYLFLAIA